MRTKKRGWIIAVIAVALIALIAVFVAPLFRSAPSEYRTYTVKRGSLSTEVLASGRLKGVNTHDVTLPDGLIVEELLVNAGESVKEDTKLARLDYDSVESVYNALSAQLAQIDSELNALSRSDTDVISLTAPVSGRVKGIYCEEGSEVLSSISESGALLTISGDGRLKIVVEDASDAAQISIGSDVTLRSGIKEHEVDSRIYGVEEGRYVILVDDREFEAGEAVIVLDENGNELARSEAVVHMPIDVFAPAGIVDEVFVELNDYVNAGTRLLRIENAGNSSLYFAKYNERKDVAKDLSLVSSFKDSPYVMADVSGVVKAINVSENTQAIDSSSMLGQGTAYNQTSAAAPSAAFSITVAGAMEIDVSVDELDIISVECGQRARVKVDALSNEEFEAVVTFVSRVGGSTGFSAILELNEQDERLMEGMFANAYITTASVEGALTIPLEIVEEDIDGEFVYVLNADGERVRTGIQTGISDGVSVEIREGLSDGDVLSYEQSDRLLNGMMRFFMNSGQTQDLNDATQAPTPAD